jgi:predicted PurR-regulated permease PerM
MEEDNMRLGQWVGLLAFILAVAILWELRQLVLLLLVASILATALNRPVRWLEHRGANRTLASTIWVVGILSLIVAVGILVVPPFLNQFQQLTELVPLGVDQFAGWFDSWLQWLPDEVAQYLPTVDDVVAQLRPLASGLANNVFRLFSGFLNVTGSMLVVVVFMVMFLISPAPYRDRFIRTFPSFYRRRVDEILTMCEVDLVAWIVGTLLNMVIIGVVSGLVLWILGVPLVLANALLTGLLEIIPNVGPFVATVLPAMIALIDSPWKALGVVVAYLLIQQLEQFLLVPIVMGQQVSLLPAVTLAAQIIFASFFGFLGLFLALPLVIIARVLLREILIKDILDEWTNPPGGEGRSRPGDRAQAGTETETVFVSEPFLDLSDFPTDTLNTSPSPPQSSPSSSSEPDIF